MGYSPFSICTASRKEHPSTWIRKFNALVPPISLDFQCHWLVSSLILKLSWSVSSHSFLAEDFFRRFGWYFFRYSMAVISLARLISSSGIHGITSRYPGAALPYPFSPTGIPFFQNARTRHSVGRSAASGAGCH